MSPDEAADAINRLIRNGHLLPVQVFGSEDDGEWGYGLCDRFSTHTPAGSDCNRAAFFLLRPSDAATDYGDIREALEGVLDRPDEDLWGEHNEKLRGHVARIDEVLD